MRSIKLHKKNLLLISLLILTLFFINKIFFGLQLAYGFRDVDWEMLYYFKSLGPLSFDHLVSAYKLMGAYTYQLYYVGFLEQITGLNFSQLHQASQLFKVISAFSVYFLVLAIFKRKLLAVLSSLIYSINYTHAGALFMLATGGYFFASIFMSLFLIAYYYSVVVKKISLWILASVLLSLTLILNTERMYPLIPLVILAELAFISSQKFKTDILSLSLRRILILLLPIVLFSALYTVWSRASIVNVGFSPNQFFLGTQLRIKSMLNGNWQLLLYPFASFGSMFLYGDYWKYLGQVNVGSFTNYLTFLIFGPILRLSVVTFVLIYFISKKPLKATAIISSSLLAIGIIIYLMTTNWIIMNPESRIHFDANQTVIPALFGFFIIILALAFFFEWKHSRRNELIPLVVGPVFSLVFILTTWIASDIQLLFIGPQRYLSIPSIGTSLFISAVLVIIYNRLKSVHSIRPFAWIIFLLLIPLLIINYKVANDFFSYELTYAGMVAVDQTKMKDNFRTLTPNINTKESSLFYFDETTDKANGYFDESTVLAGFEFWTKFTKTGELRDFPYPGMLRTNVQCPKHTHQNCLDIMREGLATVDGEKGIWYKDIIRGQTEPRFYKLNNFYAIRFINRTLVDIRGEVLKELID